MLDTRRHRVWPGCIYNIQINSPKDHTGNMQQLRKAKKTRHGKMPSLLRQMDDTRTNTTDLASNRSVNKLYSHEPISMPFGSRETSNENTPQEKNGVGQCAEGERKEERRPTPCESIFYSIMPFLTNLSSISKQKNGVGLAEGEERGETPDPRESASILYLIGNMSNKNFKKFNFFPPQTLFFLNLIPIQAHLSPIYPHLRLQPQH